MLTAGLIIWSVYFAILFFATQKIYFLKYSYLFPILLLSLTASVLSFIYIKYEESDVKIPYAVLLFPCYFLLVIAVKFFYKKMNNWLIKRKLVKNEFNDKEFTFVFVAITTSIWDKKIESNP